MKVSVSVAAGVLLAVAAGCSEVRGARVQIQTDVLDIDELLSIGSVISTSEGSHWTPDGANIMYAGGGKLWTVSSGGGRAAELGVTLGGAGHFLASQQPRYSPSGDWIAYISVKSGTQELWTWSEAEKRDVQLTRLGGRINSYSWSPDGRWIAFAGDRNGSYDIWKVDVESQAVYRMTSDRRYEVFPTWTPDSENILYVRMDERWVDHDVFAIPAAGGSPRLVVSNRNFFDYNSGGKFGYPMVSPDGRYVLYRSDRSGWINYWIVPFTGGEPRQIAAEAAEQSDGRWSPDGQQIAYTSNHNGTHSLHLVAVDGGTAQVVAAPDGMGVISSPSWSPDGTRISYALGTPTLPDDLFVVSLADGSTSQLTSSAPSAQVAATLVAPEKITYTSSEGLEIPSYLYRPRNIEAGQTLPGLLWIHGGPTSQFNDNFQQHVQYFVQRGYVVLLPNIRGSSGYGREFEDMNNRCWGRCDLEDVLAAVDYLRAQTYIDTHNIGITGTSYGGIMSMAAPTFAPGVFQAAIPIAGYADYPHFMVEQEIRHIKLVEYEFGPMEENRELYEYLSAINYVADITTPFFVIHGKGFFPESEASLNFVRELERHYKPFRYTAYPNENYYVRSRENRRQMLLDMEEFLDQNLKDHRVVPTEPARY